MLAKIGITLVLCISILCAQNVGIGTAAPTEKLHVAGNLRLDGAFMPGNAPGISGQVLISQGASTAPTWKNVAGTGASIASMCSTPSTNYIQKWTGSQLCNSIIYDNGTRIGINTTNLQADLHLVGGATLASMMLAPNETVSGDDSRLFFAEDNNGTYGMYFDYNGGTDKMELYGKINTTIYGPHLSIRRNDGNVGIGTTASSIYKVNVVGPNSGDVIVRVEADPDNSGEDDNVWLYLIQDGDRTGMKMGFLDATTYAQNGNLFTLMRRIGTVDYPDFVINTWTGDVGILTTAPTAVLSVNGSANKPGGGSWAAISDSRLKKNVTDFKAGLDVLMKIKPVNYQYNDKYFELFGESNIVKTSTYQGVIAQDLQKVAPYMVQEKSIIKMKEGEKQEEKFLEVDPSAFTYMLINAVKELKKESESLKKENELLKKRLQHIEEKLSQNSLIR